MTPSSSAARAAVPLTQMRAADVAEQLDAMEPVQAAATLSALPFDLAVRVLDQPEFDHRHSVFAHLDSATATPLVEAMSADRQADLFRALPEEERRRLLPLLSAPTRETLTMLLRYPPDTVGGIMTTELVSLPTTTTAGEALAHIIAVAPHKETIYSIFLVHPTTQALVQVVYLRDVLTAPPDTPITDVRPYQAPLWVTPSSPRDDAARIISKYNLLALPVVDEHRHLVGIVTVDDVIDTLVQELTEDVQKFGGMEALDVPYTRIGFADMIRKRAGWLCALFLGEMLTATAMGYFENEISRAVVLALFIPLIISSGGNSGSQATSLIIRAMALRELTVADWWRTALRELPAGLALGAILGVIGIARILTWQALGWYDYGAHYPLVAVTVGLALVGVVTFGSLAGSMLPFLLKRLGVDPASASAPFVATLVDVTGLVIYFTVAYVILRGTLL